MRLAKAKLDAAAGELQTNCPGARRLENPNPQLQFPLDQAVSYPEGRSIRDVVAPVWMELDPLIHSTMLRDSPGG